MQKNDSAVHDAPEEERVKDAETCHSGKFPRFPLLCYLLELLIEAAGLPQHSYKFSDEGIKRSIEIIADHLWKP